MYRLDEAYQFDWSHEDVEIAGKPMRVKVAHSAGDRYWHDAVQQNRVRRTCDPKGFTALAISWPGTCKRSGPHCGSR